MTQDEWDWDRLVMKRDWYRLGLKEYSGWQKTDKGIPHGVQLEHTNRHGKSSREIAIEWDNLSTGCFYYRDLTKSNLPWVDEGEVYHSLFWFQFEEDMTAFLKHFTDEKIQAHEK